MKSGAQMEKWNSTVIITETRSVIFVSMIFHALLGDMVSLVVSGDIAMNLRASVPNKRV